MEINKELIQKMHDEYMREYEYYLNLNKEYRQTAKASRGYYKKRGLDLNARLYQGKWSALIGVINDLRYILELPEIGEGSSAYGYIFNVE